MFELEREKCLRVETEDFDNQKEEGPGDLFGRSGRGKLKGGSFGVRVSGGSFDAGGGDRWKEILLSATSATP